MENANNSDFILDEEKEDKVTPKTSIAEAFEEIASFRVTLRVFCRLVHSGFDVAEKRDGPLGIILCNEIVNFDEIISCGSRITSFAMDHALLAYLARRSAKT